LPEAFFIHPVQCHSNTSGWLKPQHMKQTP